MGSMSDEMMLVIASLAISILLFILVIIIWSKLRAMKTKYAQMMGQTGVDNLQDVIIELQMRIHTLHDENQQITAQLQTLHDRVGRMKGHIAIQRYNAFNDKGQGSDLSFSIAMLDEHQNGAVLTAIHGREETYMYGKPVENGESKYSLSPEEKQVLQLAMKR